MKLLYVTLHAGWQSAEKESATRQYSDGIARMLIAQSDLDMRQLRIGNTGLAAR